MPADGGAAREEAPVAEAAWPAAHLGVRHRLRGRRRVNVLFDRSQQPSLTADERCDAFGVAKSTGGAKAAELRKLLHLGPFDPEWTLPSMLDRKPLACMITVDGIPVDARSMPREIQEEALRLKLIRCLPGDQTQKAP